MDNFSEASNKTGRFSNPAKRPKPDKRWTLLFIGNRGRTITLKRFKGMVVSALFVLCISIAAAVGLLFLNLHSRQEKAQLEAMLNDLKAQIKNMRYEKDLLMTRLVLAETRSKESPTTIQEKQEESDPAGEAEIGSRQQEPIGAEKVSRAAPPAPEQSEPEEVGGQSGSELSVTLENFKISPQPDEKLLRFQFKIKNTSANSQHVSGHTVVVLKADQLPPEKWMAVPPMPLADGQPTGRQRGFSFGINYFKTMRFSSNYPKFADEYQIATVYVFTRRGEKLLEENFPVKLPAVEASEAPSASGETSPPAPAAAAPDAASKQPPGSP
ncbi:MAG: hypothetical protein P8X90_09140 [Desulfobacterales bacterium]